MSAPPVSLYLHVPFCTVRCAYCDFNTYAGIDEQMPEWETALREELRRWAPAVAGRPVPTVFFGGGTPSLLSGATIQRILDAVRADYGLARDAEVSLEANPESARPERLAAYRAAGVNRLSIGVQALEEADLRFLDRLHDAAGARRAVEAARSAGFDNVSIDLIYGLPGQSVEAWRSVLERALAWGPEHVSCYALTVEEGTPLALRVQRGEAPSPDPDTQASMADAAEALLTAAGYPQYEISNYARPGFECRHNLVYWRGHDYLGLGPGAHGLVDGVRYSMERSPLRYSAALRREGGAHGLPSPAIVEREDPDEATRLFDALSMGLRLNEGMDGAALAGRYPSAWAQAQAALEWSDAHGLLTRAGGRLRLTERGRRLANEVLVRLLEPSLV